MAIPTEQPFDVTASDQESALREGATVRGLAIAELQIINTEALSHLPWQPKKFRYTLIRRPPPVESRDGEWTVEYRLGKVWLTVQPPRGQGRPVMPEEVLAARRSWPATTSLDRDRLYAVVEKAPGQPFDVATYDIPRTAPFGGLTSSNDMAGYLVIGPKESAPDRLRQAEGALEAAGIVFGIDRARLEAAVATGIPGEAFLVAEGVESETGADAILIAGSSRAAPLIRPDGSMDFTASQLDEPVAIGDVLLAVQPGKSGTEGQTVRAAALPTTYGKVVDLEALRGDGVAVSADGTQLVAAIAGTPQRRSDHLSLLPLLRIEGNADTAAGAIDFAGNVVIDGDVLDGVSVRAGGDLLVKGSAQAATIVARGTIILRHGMLGGGAGQVQSGAEVQAELLHDCTVTAATDVRVSKEITNATVTAGRSVLAGQGTITGGLITAGHEILAGVVGTVRGVLTKLAIQSSSTALAAESVEAAPANAPVHEHGHARPSIRIHDRIYAPAQISFGILKFPVEHETPFCKFMEDHGTIVVGSFA